MPELPEVESVRRLIHGTLLKKRLDLVSARDDTIVFCRQTAAQVASEIQGQALLNTGRKGKLFWLKLEQAWLYGHLGMSGWVRLAANGTPVIREHGSADQNDESGQPRHLKLLFGADPETLIAFTDGRRLARIWLGGPPEEEPKVKAMGRDALLDLPDPSALHQMVSSSKAPVKAWLLDQHRLSGVGNWIADEVLYQARIAPQRLGSSLTDTESAKLHEAIELVIGTAVSVNADKDQLPKDWLFHARWGGTKGTPQIDGREIRREPVGGRTTAWVPEVQR